MFIKGMVIDWGKYGLQVNGLGLGYFKIEMNMVLVNDEKFIDWLVGCILLCCWGDVEDLVGVVVFLVSDVLCFVNGYIFYVDGGVIVIL